MKTYKLYTFFFLLSMLFGLQTSFGFNTSQEPEKTRQFDNDFKERYSGSKYNYEGVDIVTETPSGSGEYKDYKKTDDLKKEDDNDEHFSINLGPLSWLFYIAIIGAVVFLVYILMNEGSSGLFTRNRNKTVNLYNEITAENIEETDIDSFILSAEKSGDYRLAIRYYYLLVLKHLSLKNHIKFEDDKTNSEYLNEITGKPFSKDFEYTSYLYNYIWYGEFPLNADNYKKAKTNFATLLKQVN
ncbi:hypothetical protein [Flavisericum labens]|uniref:hypothetical protein n=1 Tax=Flavisericum labens TaxID=3377112 RepID=UPI00387B0A27